MSKWLLCQRGVVELPPLLVNAQRAVSSALDVVFRRSRGEDGRDSHSTPAPPPADAPKRVERTAPAPVPALAPPPAAAQSVALTVAATPPPASATSSARRGARLAKKSTPFWELKQQKAAPVPSSAAAKEFQDPMEA